MYHAGTERSSLPHFPVEFGAIPALQCGNEVQPNKRADDYHGHQEKQSHAHQHTPLSGYWSRSLQTSISTMALSSSA